MMNQSEIVCLLHTTWAGQQICCFESLNSTNQKAQELAEEGYPAGTLVVAENQTAGRGRRGRNWDSKAGMGIFMSLVLKPEISPEKAPMLTLVSALAVSKGISKITGECAQIKWPNDLVMKGRKICGILTEMSPRLDYVVVGIGINVHNSDFSEEISQVAGSLYTETGKHFSRAKLVAAVLEAFEQYYELFLQREDLSLMMEEYNRLLVNQEKEVRVLDQVAPFSGIAKGITEKGELMVDTKNGRKLVSSGEVSVRGIYGYV